MRRLAGACRSTPTLYGRATVSLRQDVADTWRLVSWRAALGLATVSWRAYHAGGALIMGVVCAIVGAWWVLSGDLTGGVAFLAISCAWFAYWRYVLPEALWHVKVDRTLRGE